MSTKPTSSEDQNATPSASPARDKEVLRAIVLEDSLPNRSILVLHLKRHLFEVHAFINGKEAQHAIVNGLKDIDLVISDYMMPEMDGLEFLKWFRQNKQYAKVPFLVAPAVAERAVVVKARELGATGFLVKPLVAENISARLAEYFPHLAPQVAAQNATKAGSKAS